MIIYSVQNQIDLCPIAWTFDDTRNQFYNWKNQPIGAVTAIVPRDIRCQFSISDKPVNSIISQVYADGQLITGVSIVNYIETLETTEIYELLVKGQSLPLNSIFYVQLTVNYTDEDFESEVFRSSCFKIEQGKEETQLIKIEYSNTVTNRFIGGILFIPDTYRISNYYFKKYDSEIELTEDENEADFQGNNTLINKTHSETDIFEIIDMPKKLFMGLVKISENDIIFINGRRANFNVEKAVESRIGIDEVCFINAYMRVTYADDNGLLEIQSDSTASYLALNSENLMLIDSNNKLKTK